MRGVDQANEQFLGKAAGMVSGGFAESIAIRVHHELGLESRRDWGEYGAELSRIDADPKSSDQRSGGFRNVLLMNFSGFEVPLQTTGANIRSNSSAVVQSSMLEVIS